MRVKVLGSAAGGGFPQWNCACPNCRGVREGTLRGKPRSQVQVAVSGDGERWFLLNASPDLRVQIESTPELQPQFSGAKARHTPIAGVILTSGDLDNVLGLLLLREFQALEVWATPSVRHILTEDNSIFRMLQRERQQITWRDVKPGSRLELGSELFVTPRATASSYPEYVSEERRGQLAEGEAVIGLEVEHGGKKMAFFPALPAVDDELMARLSGCDLLMADGTFWTDDELVRLREGGRTGREMGHMPISGQGGSLQRFAALEGPKKIFIHINNTNPVLNEESNEAQAVRAAGWTVAEDGMEFTL